MNKPLFWIFTVALGFVSPLISFGLLVLHYLPDIIHGLSLDNSIEFYNSDSKFDSDLESSQMKSFSRDTLEESR